MQENSLITWTHSLFNMGQTLAVENSERVRQQLLEHIVSGFNADSGSIALLNHGESQLILAAGTGSAANFIGSSIPVGEGVLGWVVEHGQPVMLTGDISRDTRFKALKFRSNPSQPMSALCWPLIVQGRTVGAVSINRGASHPKFTEQDLRDGASMVGLVSLVVDNMRVHEEYRKRIYELHQEKTQRSMSEARLSAILDTAPGAVIVVDGQQRIVVFNKGAELMFGYHDAQMIGQELDQLLSHGAAYKYSQYIEKFSSDSSAARHVAEFSDVTWCRKNGVTFPASANISLVMVSEQKYFIAILRDLTQEREMETKLAASTKALADALLDRQKIMDTVRDVIFKLDAEARLLSLNRYALLMTGYMGEELFGRSALYIIPESEHAAVQAAIQITLIEGEVEFDAHLLCKDGRQVLYHWIAVALRDAQGNIIGITGTGRDITATKRMEDTLRKEKAEQELLIDKLKNAQGQLLQSEKMASIGQLAAGVAHEINNPVGYVSSNLGTLKTYVADLINVVGAYERVELQAADQSALFSEVRGLKQQLDLEYLRQDTLNLVKESMEGLVRVKKIVQDLKDFSHIDNAEWQWADLHKGIDSTLNITSNELKYKAKIVKEYGEIPEIECLASQVNQVFMNLLVNAAQAIETRGVITIRSGAENDWVWVEIADTGKGIAQENLQRIFDPFFTTKPVGKGTGLGLSLSYSIVQKHHGRIEVHSEAGKGTAFKVWLPVHRPAMKVEG